MADRRVRLTPPLLALLAPGIAWAQPASEPAPRPDFGMYFVFWFGAVILMLLVGRVVFREQLGERRTLRRMMREIGPFFPEFDIDAVKRWVHLCADRFRLAGRAGLGLGGRPVRQSMDRHRIARHARAHGRQRGFIRQAGSHHA